MPSHSGGCHCGVIRVTFDSEIPAEAFGVRACQCSFCRKHAGHTISDPAGRVTIEVREETSLSRYQFALRTCEFFLCRHCGVYVAAVLTDGDRAWAVVNVHALDDRAAFTGSITPMEYGSEDVGARVSRRKEKWTP